MASAAREAGVAPRTSRSVAVIVVTYRSVAVLPGFLAALPAALRGVERTEVVVVDNDSDDGTVPIAIASGVVDRVVALGSNRGYAAGINEGVAAAPGHDAYLVMNPDIRLWPHAVGFLAQAATWPRVGISVPRLEDEHGQLQHSLRREPSVLRALGEAVLGGRAGRWPALGEVVTESRAYSMVGVADWATGGAMFMTARCLQALGPWDESFFLYGEEVEFALRARDAGFLLAYVPEARATRLVGEGPSPAIWALMCANKAKLFRRRHGRCAAALYRAVLTGGEALRAVMGRAGSRAALRRLISRESVLSHSSESNARKHSASGDLGRREGG